MLKNKEQKHVSWITQHHGNVAAWKTLFCCSWIQIYLRDKDKQARDNREQNPQNGISRPVSGATGPGGEVHAKRRYNSCQQCIDRVQTGQKPPE